ncbi:HP1 family phage holin [Psychromonas arctica]|uniref:HP1 family phage holin n=1 Tax=Psychromonas arctica TaxID=168275 RepID=UPI002FD1CF5E
MNELLTKISYSFSAFLSFISLTSLNDIALLIGIFLGVMTFIVTWFYKHKTYNLQVKTASLMAKSKQK